LKRAQSVPLPPLSLDRRRRLAPQIVAAIRGAIDAGRFDHGARLPPTRTLAAAFGVSRQVVVAAFEELQCAGDIVGYTGAGSYVRRTQRPLALSRRTLRDPDGHAVFVAPLASD
jgi:GntR family transcriptional regulator/MocR family aminotransferase